MEVRYFDTMIDDKLYLAPHLNWSCTWVPIC